MDKYQQKEPSLTSLSFKNALARGVWPMPIIPGESLQVQGLLATQ